MRRLASVTTKLPIIDGTEVDYPDRWGLFFDVLFGVMGEERN